MTNGNQAFFFEPMFANSIMTYDRLNRHFYDFLRGVFTEDQLNENCVKEFKRIKDTIYYKYHGGSVYNTSFWKNVKKFTKNFMKNSELFNAMFQIAKINNEAGYEQVSTNEYLYSWDAWKKIDKYFGYKFFN
jgi:hypothetical protein